jgi:cell division cycle protein 37
MTDIQWQAGILSLEEELIDATTEEGRQRIKEMERGAAAAKTETYDDPE